MIDNNPAKNGRIFYLALIALAAGAVQATPTSRHATQLQRAHGGADVEMGQMLGQHLRSDQGLSVRIAAREVWRGHRGLSGEWGYEDVIFEIVGAGLRPLSSVKVVAVTDCRDEHDVALQPQLVETLPVQCAENLACQARIERLPRAYETLRGSGDYTCHTELAFWADGTWHHDPLGVGAHGNFRLELKP